MKTPETKESIASAKGPKVEALSTVGVDTATAIPTAVRGRLSSGILVRQVPQREGHADGDARIWKQRGS